LKDQDEIQNQHKPAFMASDFESFLRITFRANSLERGSLSRKTEEERRKDKEGITKKTWHDAQKGYFVFFEMISG